MKAPRCTIALACALAVVGAASVFVGAQAVRTPSAAAANGEQLPDLDQETPSQLSVVAVGSRSAPSYRLGFQSAVRNIGAGPLIIDGHRVDVATPTMTADQVIQRGDGTPSIVPSVGRLQYVVATSHQHWHLLQFDRYELHRAGGKQAFVRDRKSGFCLGDRYGVLDRVVQNAVPSAVYRTNCGLENTGLLQVREGISVGYGDNYPAFVEGQDLPLDGLRAGRYVLVHRANGDRKLRELSYANNAASVLFDLRWKGGVPYLRVLRTCPNTDRCERLLKTADPTNVSMVATGLEIPWDIAFMPGGGALVTERPGRIRLLDSKGRLRGSPVAQVAVSARGEGGLLGIALDPEFAVNRFVYLYYTTAAGMKLERWRWTGDSVVRDVTLVDAIAAGSIHDSGRISFGPDGRLYVATGDSGQPALAQDPNSLNGKFLALTPAQFRGNAVVRPEIVASGLRNPQGFGWQPGTGLLITNDHGPSGFDGPEGYDEIDQIVPGGNYGWPKVIGASTGGGRFIPPLRVYREAIAPSGATFVKRSGSSWTGNYILAALRGEELRRLVLNDGEVVADLPLLAKRFGRLRTVKEAPDGSLYVLTSNRDGRGTPKQGDDRIIRIVPPR